uniref:Zinc finger protein 692 n=1 Tax=Ovis aries TaxID=9940 RepID=A0AC11DG72_SHEEP
MRKLRPRQRVELGPLEPYPISVSSTPQALVLMAASPADASRKRREKRRQLDARRSKCRIRLGGHMEQWCLLKEQLGFSLHSQLAKFLLDRSKASVVCDLPRSSPTSWSAEDRGPLKCVSGQS